MITIVTDRQFLLYPLCSLGNIEPGLVKITIYLLNRINAFTDETPAPQSYDV
jgi:hypothetical protein